MSYILEALKKSDQQRQRGATPTLPVAQITVAPPKQSFYMYYGLLAAGLLCIGIVIGWLRPWQAEQPARASDPTGAGSALPISNPNSPAPLAEPSEMDRNAEHKSTASNLTPTVQTAPRADAMQTGSSAPISTGKSRTDTAIPVPLPKTPTSPANAVQEQKVTPIAELPLTVQQEIPAMKIQLHSYSSNPTNSLVSINSRMLKEGESLAPGLRLEQITPDGVIFSYKGYRFQHGIW